MYSGTAVVSDEEEEEEDEEGPQNQNVKSLNGVPEQCGVLNVLGRFERFEVTKAQCSLPATEWQGLSKGSIQNHSKTQKIVNTLLAAVRSAVAIRSHRNQSVAVCALISVAHCQFSSSGVLDLQTPLRNY